MSELFRSRRFNQSINRYRSSSVSGLSECSSGVLYTVKSLQGCIDHAGSDCYTESCTRGYVVSSRTDSDRIEPKKKTRNYCNARSSPPTIYMHGRKLAEH